MDFFNYHLPKEKIAQSPVSLDTARSNSKLLYAKKSKGELEIEDLHVQDLLSVIKSGDLLILNNTKVIPCRFFVSLESGQTETEIFLLSIVEEKSTSEVWHALARPMKRLKENAVFALSENITAKVISRTADGQKIILELSHSSKFNSLLDAIIAEGSMPIPGYIRNGRAEEFDKELYQTVFAENVGSVAAPTAGLHFTNELIEKLRQKGIDSTFITLHVGPASFLPVRDISTHEMPVEKFNIPLGTREKIEKCRAGDGRVIAVGTTSVRALESMEHLKDTFREGTFFSTNIFITPGYVFKNVDLLFTNFHQPQTTHLLLVAAFFGEENIAKIYQHALDADYRFLSYGDAMLMENKDYAGI